MTLFLQRLIEGLSNGAMYGVVAVALVPGAGPWAVIRSLRVLRVLRLLTMVPSLRKVTSRFAMERVKSTTALPV